MDVDVTVRGAVPPDAGRRAAERVAELEDAVDRPVTGARVVLTQEANERIPRPARAEGEILIGGQPVRARVDGPVMSAAIDDLARRLREQMRRYVDRRATARRVPPGVEAGQWRRGAWTPSQPPRSWRPAGEREVIRRKSFALEPMSAAEAAADLEALDHDFFLYRDADTGADSVLYHHDDGHLAVLQPQDAPVPDAADGGPVREPSRYSEPLPLAEAIRQMDMLNHRFLAFTDAATGRGAVLYLRYDGHYGLIQPADG